MKPIIITGITDFHQQLYFLRFINQKKGLKLVLVQNHKTITQLNQLINLFASNTNVEMQLINDVSNYIKLKTSLILFLNSYQRINIPFFKTWLDQYQLYIFAHPKIRYQLPATALNNVIIKSKVLPSELELQKINFYQKQKQIVTNRYKIKPVYFLSEKQIRLLALSQISSLHQLLNIPGIGRGWLEQWGDKIRVYDN